MELWQEESLTSGGDCDLHSHRELRSPTQDFLQGLSRVERLIAVSTSYVVTSQDAIVLVDASAGSFAVTLPQATNGRRLTFKKVNAANTVTLTPRAPDTIDGAATRDLSSQWEVVHIKAYSSGWVIL
jgi:hypothetical protein